MEAALIASALSALSLHAAPAPVVVGTGPHADPTDRTGGGFLRVTFSPDGDGRNDRVAIRVRAPIDAPLVLRVRATSTVGVFDLRRPAGATTLSWNGEAADGGTAPVGSYVIQVCAFGGACAATKVLAHLRILSAYVPRATGVSPGETVPVVVASDRLGPFTIDLAPASDRKAQGAGVQTVFGPGSFEYRIPRVRGGLWLLRVTSGSVVTLYPLVVHEATLPLDAPPRGTALLVYPYITWRAYNRTDENRDAVADTWYSHPSDPVVPLRGPFERLRRETYLASREADPGTQQAFANWLQAHDLTAQHVTDVELGRLPLDVLRRYAVVVFPGHTEYYEQRTYERLLAYRAGGGRLYFMSGNSFYGQARVGRDDVTRLSYRYRTPTQSDFRIAVTGFRECCWPHGLVPRYRIAGGVVARLPWLFAGTDVHDGDELGIASGEVDTVDARLSPRGTVTVASVTIPPFVPPGTVRYGWIGARRFAFEAAGVRARQVAIAYAKVGRGEVFSWGATDFLTTLRSPLVPAAQREALDRIALNVWRRFTRASAPASTIRAAASVFVPSAGHRVAGFALDRESLALAEDPVAPGSCPVVRLVPLAGGAPRRLTRAGGPTCRLGGRFWMRPGARAIGVALVRALWVVRNGSTALAVKASPTEREVVLARATSIGTNGPFLGPVAATHWLRLFARYTRAPGGTLRGGVISGNNRTLWSATGPVLPLGLDDEEHAVAVGARGEIAMWHAHGARYGRVGDAHARAAAIDRGVVVMLRADRARLDVRELSGRLVRSWPVARGAAPLLDLDGDVAVYVSGRTVHELDVSNGHDRVVATAPSGTKLLDAQIERRSIVYAYRGAKDSGRVVAIAR